MEVANLIVNIFIALGTVGAVIVALWNIISSNKPRYKISQLECDVDYKLYYSVMIYNTGNIPIIIKRIGFSDEVENTFYEFSDLMLQKRRYIGKEEFSSCLSYPITISPYESIELLITKDELLKIKSNNVKRKKEYIRVIFYDEKCKKIKIKKKNIDKFLKSLDLFEFEMKKK